MQVAGGLSLCHRERHLFLRLLGQMIYARKQCSLLKIHFVPEETVIKIEMKSIEKDFKKLGSKTDIGI